MRRVMKVVFLVVVAAAAGSFWGCNERLQDPLEGEAILTIEKIEPVLVQSDVTATDPNGVPQILQTDKTVITVKNRPRTPTSSTFSDAFIQKAERICTRAGVFIAGGSAAGGGTVATGATLAITTTAVTLNEKLTSGVQNETWKCQVRFLGEDVAGNPVKTEFATFFITFVDG